MFDFLKNIFVEKRGNILLFAIIFGTISMTVIIVGVTGYAIGENKASLRKHNRELAFQMADAGINYYKWHLAHDKTDYFDGNSTSTPGPYEHDYTDKDGNVIGKFSLTITPPQTGSTVVTIQSAGWLLDQPESVRTIKARVGFPALTDYAFLAGGDVWIGDDEETHGKFHANGGIRFDGVGDSPITSAMATYTCKTFHGCGNQEKPGIWGDGGPTSYWSFPVPAKSFTAVTAKLSEIEDGANSGGIYLSSSGQQGWRLEFTSAGQVKAYKVLTTDCYKAKDVGSNNYFWPCIDIDTESLDATYPMPSNGYIYVEDMVWVDGVINGRATVGTAVGKSIIINGDITYTAKDGSHALGLIAEQNILIPHNSPDDLEIDAAVLAQNGAAKRYYYPGDTKDNLYIYGSIISYGIWTWSWVSGGGSVISGYENTNSTYDLNLTYSPPPGFPVGSEYNLISWEEVD